MTAEMPLASVRLQSHDNCLHLILPAIDPTETKDAQQSWLELEQSLSNTLRLQEKRWPPRYPVHLVAQDRLLDGRQLQGLADILREFSLELQWVVTQRRQTAVAAASAGYSVDQTPPKPQLFSDTPPAQQPPLVLKQTLRSGTEIRHPGDVILLGDVNPGSEIIADGDILIWGTLRGTAHAGAAGDQEAVIMILRLGASQIRIADRVARVPAANPDPGHPEIAHITPEGIRLTTVRQFKRRK
ncbi:septum site-determining protein MinC [Synechocystis sp. LKSZ1]|uniref:septum site-determining protein MinC n=1 Tax=Synechocystis sp. LKSZ1 TaxID=3144951 RepID=UPI00336BCD9D